MDRNRIPLSEALEGFFIAANARRLSRHTLRDYDTTFREIVHQGASPVTDWAL